VIFIGTRITNALPLDRDNFMFIMKEDGRGELGFLEEGSAILFAESIGLEVDNEVLFLYNEKEERVVELEEIHGMRE
tara:strand:- start:5521 stop:5751 length:231 start_codon:yes stop_codon:yes gene_type:complete